MQAAMDLLQLASERESAREPHLCRSAALRQLVVEPAGLLGAASIRGRSSIGESALDAFTGGGSRTLAGEAPVVAPSPPPMVHLLGGSDSASPASLLATLPPWLLPLAGALQGAVPSCSR